MKKIIFLLFALTIIFSIIVMFYFEDICDFLVCKYNIITRDIGSIDPNWLLATCAQSAAAIIAIIGGFILSRILALSSEKNSIIAQIKDLNIKIDSKFAEYQKEKRKVIEWKVSRDIINRFESMVGTGKDIKINDEMIESKIDKFKELNNFMISELLNEDIYPYYEKIISVIKDAYDYQNEFDELPTNDEIINDSNIKKEERRIYKSVFQVLRSSHQSRPPYTPNDSVLKTIGTYNNFREVESRNYSQVTNSLFTKKAEYQSLKNQKNDLKRRLQNFKNPKGLIYGFLVFGYFTLVGVVLPIVFMPLSKRVFNIKIKLMFIILFITGILAVFTYILKSMYDLLKITANIFETDEKAE